MIDADRKTLADVPIEEVQRLFNELLLARIPMNLNIMRELQAELGRREREDLYSTWSG